MTADKETGAERAPARNETGQAAAEERKTRLAAALRENLFRRKAQSRAKAVPERDSGK